MKTTKIFAFLSFFLLISSGVVAQVELTAGEVGFNTTILDPEISLANALVDTDVTDSVDLNCDGNADIEFVLHKSLVAADGVNTLTSRILNANLEYCMSGMGFEGRPKYYSFGQELNCGLGFDWINDTLLYMGSFGGFVNIPPAQMTDRYVGYRFNGDTEDEQFGWMKVNFNLDDSGGEFNTITAVIEEILIFCSTENVGDIEVSAELRIFPNPGANKDFNLESNKPINKLVLYSVVGNEIDFEVQNNSKFTIPGPNGIYILEVQFSDGQSVRRRVIKN